MSARDAESGSSTYKGGSGRAGGLGNGGIGGGMGGGGNWGGGMGGGAGRNGGIGNRTGLTTGNRMYGGVAMGRPGGKAMNPGAWGMRPAAPIGYGPLSGVTRPRAAAPIPAAAIPNERILAIEDVPPPAPSLPSYQGWGSALQAYQSPYGPEYIADVEKYGLANYVRNSNLNFNNTGYDPGYRVDSRAMTNEPYSNYSNNGWSGYYGGSR